MKEGIREHVISLGVDLCGFANIDRFSDAPIGFGPTDIWQNCKSIISIAIAIPKGFLEIKPRLIYAHYNNFTCLQIDAIAFNTSKYLENEFKCKAVPLPSDSPYEYWDKESLEGRGLLSLKHIAVKAGLGTLGKNSLFVCNQFGNMVTLGCILTDLDLESDALVPSICIQGCRKCVDSCPVNAIESNIVNQGLCRNNTYGKTERGFDTVDCNSCRVACPLNQI